MEGLRSNGDRSRALMQALPDIVYELDPHGNFTFVNDAVRRLGYDPRELVGKHFSTIIHPSDVDAVSRAVVLQSCKGTGIGERGAPKLFDERRTGTRKTTDLEVRLLSHDDKLRQEGPPGRIGTVTVLGDVIATGHHDLDAPADRKFLGTVGIIRDVTERKRAEEALGKGEERYRNLFEHSPISLWEQDFSHVAKYFKTLRRAGVKDFRAHLENHPEDVRKCAAMVRIVDVNQATLDLYEARSKEAFRRGLADVFAEETYGVFKEELIALAEGKTRFESEAVSCTLGGTRKHVVVRCAFPPGGEEALSEVLISVVDLTEIRRAEAEVERRKQETLMHQAEALAVTGRLAAGVAHEINNPLQGIKGQLRLLADEMPAPVREGKRMNYIKRGLDQIAQITSRLLDLHRQEESAPGTSGVMQVANDLIGLVSSVLQRQGISVEIHVAPPELCVPMSPSRLTEVLLNLVLNAQDAMPDGGFIRILATGAAGDVSIKVSDEGIGIPDETKAKMFSPFFTTKGALGTGLGLTVTHSLVSSAGGEILVTSEEGKGATFDIRFPKAGSSK